MKTAIHIFSLLIIAISLLQKLDAEGEPKTDIKPDEIRNVSTIGLIELIGGSKVEGLTGKIVRLRFNHRPVQPLKDDQGKLIGEIDEYIYKRGSANIGKSIAEIPIEGRDWYLKIPTNPESTPKTVYVRILGKEGEKVRCAVLGRELRSSSFKPEFVW